MHAIFFNWLHLSGSYKWGGTSEVKAKKLENSAVESQSKYAN